MSGWEVGIHWFDLDQVSFLCSVILAGRIWYVIAVSGAYTTHRGTQEVAPQEVFVLLLYSPDIVTGKPAKITWSAEDQIP